MRTRDFERLYKEHAGPLLAFLTYRSGDSSLADDLLADTFERALRGRKRFNPSRSSEKTWLYAIALNLLRDQRRRTERGRRVIAQSEAGTPVSSEGGLEQVEQRDRVARAMDSLNSNEREIVAMRYGADLTLREIATLLNQPTGTTAAQLYRALERMAGALDDSPR